VRRSLLWIVLAGLALSVAGPPVAPGLASPPAALGEGEQADWVQRLEEARVNLRRAETRLSEAEFAYQDWRQRKRPRGAKKAELVAEIDSARRSLGELRALYPQLLESARQAGVSPGALRPLELDTDGEP